MKTFITLIFIFASSLIANTKPKNIKIVIDKNFGYFIENAGQFGGKFESERPSYFYENRACKLAFYKNYISFNFTSNTQTKSGSEFSLKGKYEADVQSVYLSLIGINTSANIISYDQADYFINYYNQFGNFKSINTYKSLIYKNIYNKIDLIFLASDLGIKYEFHVRPGGKISDIKLQWKGTKSLELLSNQSINYTLPNDKSFTESAPISYLNNGKSIQVKALKNDNIISYSSEQYDKNATLIIDPILNWATYYGGIDSDNATGVSTDSVGNTYLCGATLSSTSIAYTGSYQSLRNGKEDGYVVKFNKSGIRLWSTYYGASLDDEFNAVVSDSKGNVYVAAYTLNSGLSSSAVHQSSYNKLGDGLIVKFNINGQRVWASYYGGDNLDNIYGISLYKDLLYLTGITYSGNNIASLKSYQSNYGTAGDAFIACFDTSGFRNWGTYVGGTGIDKANDATTDLNGNVYICGFTDSKTNFSRNSQFQSSHAGQEDGFIAKYNTTGKLVWCSYYGGEAADLLYGIGYDKVKGIYVSGRTKSKTGISTSGAWQTTLGGGWDAYLAKFDTSGTQTWSSYFGGTSDDYGAGITSDARGFIYTSGNTASTKSIAYGNAFKNYYSGSIDGFLAKWTDKGKLIWSTYYGGTENDFGVRISMLEHTRLYFAGYSFSSTGISKSGGHQSTFNGYNDAFLVSFDNLSGIVNDAAITNLDSPKNNQCAGPLATIVKLKNYGTGYLDSVQIFWKVNKLGSINTRKWKGRISPDSAEAVSIGFVFYTVGSDTLRVWTGSPNGVTDSFAYNDTFFAYITTIPAPKPQLGNDFSICQGNFVTIGQPALSGHSYVWNSTAGLSSKNAQININPSSSATYYLTVNNLSTGCIGMDSITVNVLPKPNTGIIDRYIKTCAGDQVIIMADSVNNTLYQWADRKGFTLNKSKLSVFPTIETNYYLTMTNLTSQCVYYDSITIKPSPKPSRNSWFVDKINTPTPEFYIKLPNPLYVYRWSFSDSPLDTLTGTRVAHLFPKNQVYKVSLIISNSSKCGTVSDSIINISVSSISSFSLTQADISVFPNPTLEVANVYINSPINVRINYNIIDVAGKTVLTGASHLVVGNNLFTINLSKAGAYQLVIMYDGKVLSYPIIRK